jgi:hypothetical protein
MAKILKLGLVISAVGFSAVAREIGTVDSRVSAIGSTLERLKTRQRDAMQAMDREYTDGGKSVRRYADEVERLGRRIDGLAAKEQRLKAIGDAHAKARSNMTARQGDVMMAIGTGVTLAAPGVVAGKFEDRIKQISIVGELYKQPGAEAALAQEIRRAAVKHGVSQEQVLDGVEALVAQGADPKLATRRADLMARVHLATRTEMEDLAGLIFTMDTKFKLSEAQIEEGLNALAKSGKLGQYELKQMAKSFPELGGAAASFGSKGLSGVQEMGAMMQIMRAGAGTTGEADTYMRNWFSHLSARSTQDHFEKVGINFEKSKLKLMIEKRVSAVEAGFMVFDEYLDRVSKRGFVDIRDKKGKLVERIDVRKELKQAYEIAKKEGLEGEALQARIKSALERVGLSAVLQDIQATQAFLAYRSGKEKYSEIRADLAKPDTSQTIDRDYAEQIKLATVRTQGMKVAVTDLIIEIGNRLAPVFGVVAREIGVLAKGATTLMQRFPKTSTWAIGAVAGLMLLVTGIFAIGTAISALKFAWTGLALLGTINPIGLAIVATIAVIAGAAYLIYRNWDTVKSWAVGMWGEVRSAFAGGVGGVMKLLINWSPLGLFYKAFAGVLSYFGVELPGKFTEYGAMLIGGLADGIKSRVNGAIDAIKEIGGSIKDKFTSMLGIKSPSRVFMGFGHNIGEGAAIGISNSVSRVRGAVGKLSGAALSGVSAASQALDGMRSGGGPAKFEMNFSPTIHVQGGGGAGVTDQVKQGLSASLPELRQMMRQLMQEEARRAYS